MTENMMIELNEAGDVAVHGNMDDAAFLNLISPAIVHLDETIQDLQSFVRSKAFGKVVQDAAQKLGNIAETETSAV